eukprot:CAMPEP_0198255216 /NCGR_PEP_ID=MMETSP1447-20131203/5385_1 /TAXON_ID=420782 /ORGANISM="Chaetoceros dichaeta, Strain CCMP1751" /LENGTH=481 /DNA_ID=CAMNT_0043941535 /DNA_START=145 /DNA_END=1590 /DNA_ORIENTATION=+
MFNESGSRIEINWVNPDTQDRVLQTSPYLYAGATHNLNSYATHRFEVKELPSTKTQKCKNGPEGPLQPDLCGVAFFTVNDNFDQVFYIREGLHIQHDDNHSLALSRANTLLEECEAGTINAADDDVDAKGMVGDMARCITENLKFELNKSVEESDFQGKVRGDMAELLATYACGDAGMEATEADKTVIWNCPRHSSATNGGGGGRRNLSVDVMHDRPGSKVHVIKNFVSEAECRAMEEGLPNVGGGMRSSSTFSSSSSADSEEDSPSNEEDGERILKHDIGIPWEKEDENNPLTNVSRRILDYTNHVLHLDINEHGQEGLTSIQYASAAGTGPNIPSSSSGDNTQSTTRYEPVNAIPHCGDKCLGKPHRVGQRIAGIVMYCRVHNQKDGGGATNFHNFGAHHVPTAYSAMWFSYMDPETFRMDGDGYTEHTDCPVLKGEKRVVRQWIRHGVHKDLPWDEYEHETAEITMKQIEEDEDEQEL